MMKSLELVIVPMSVFLLANLPAMAHHSAMYFDMNLEVMHESVTVVEFQVANPHGILIYVVMDEDGNETEWTAELPSANFSRRGGVIESLLKPGDKLVAVIGEPGLPGRTRENLMRLTRAEFQNGDVATFSGISATYTRAGAE